MILRFVGQLMDSGKIVAASEDSIQIQFEQKICPEVNRQISDFCEVFALMTKDMPEVLEIVPTYCSVNIYFDEKKSKCDLIKQIALEVLEKQQATGGVGIGAALGSEAGSRGLGGKIISIPVCYEDEEFAPDLELVAEHAGLSKQEVIKIHSSTDYLIYMMGFLPGFPYLGGMDGRLETPRLETPRTKIPAGSVAIGGAQTGLYPVESPGGWNIIGRTPVRLFDMKREPQFLYKAGDKIRFVPVTRAEFENFDEEAWLKELGISSENSQCGESAKSAEQTYECGGGIKILEPGLMTTVQDLGITGFQKYGIGQSGVMDEKSFALANRLCGNPENAACLETTLCGPEIRFINPCDFAISGADFACATLDGNPVQMNKRLHAAAGSVLKCGFASKGLRSYIAFSGGLLVPQVFGSRSTNLKSKIGGYLGRKLESGDELAIGWLRLNSQSSGEGVETKIVERDKNSPFLDPILPTSDVLVLDCIKSSQFDSFDSESVKSFSSEVYTVSAESDRMGIRFSGPALECGKTDIISDSIPFGAVQITSAGLPVVMAADRQTTGGYAKIACVKKHSMCLLAQAVPGTKVMFKIEEA